MIGIFGIFLIIFAQPMVTLKQRYGDRAADGVQRLRRHDAHGTCESARHQLRGQRHDVARLRRASTRRFVEGERGTLWLCQNSY